MSAFCKRRVNQRIVRGQMRQVHFLVIILADDFDAVLEHRHHAEPQQIHFHDSHVGAIFLVPLHHHAPGHGGRLEWNNRIKLALAHHHSAGMLTQMPGNVLRHRAKLNKLADLMIAADPGPRR